MVEYKTMENKTSNALSNLHEKLSNIALQRPKSSKVLELSLFTCLNR